MSRAVIFLDRDGTINVDRGYVHRVEDWEFLPGAVDAIRELRSAGYTIAVVSNQSGIAAGKYMQDDLDRLHAYFVAELARQGAAIDAYAYCPHAAEDDCQCRKPKTGLSRQIERQLTGSINYQGSWTIGDKSSDIGFGRALGTRTFLLRSRYWQPDNLSIQPDGIANSLLEATASILSETNPGAVVANL